MAEAQERLKGLSPEKLRLLARRLKKTPEVKVPLPTLVPAPEARHEPFPLTDVQQSLWVGRRDLYELGNVSTHGYWELAIEDLDVERLSASLRRMIERHEMLRAIVLASGQQQVLAEVPAYEIRVLDLRNRPVEEVRAELTALRAELSHQVLPADEWPLFDIRVTLFDGGKGLIHVSFDFLIGDLWSFRRLIEELRQDYQEPGVELPPLGMSFRDYVLALVAFESTDAYRQAETYWQERLASMPPGPELPVKRHLLAAVRPRFTRRARELDAPAWQRLRGLAARRKISPSGLLLSAYGLVLSLWSKSPRFTLNITYFNRLPVHPHIDRIIGDFASLTLLTVDASRPGSFAEWTGGIQRQLWQNLAHGHISAVRLMRELAHREGRAPSALMPVVFTSLLIEKRTAAPEAGEETAGGADGTRSAEQEGAEEQGGEAAFLGISQTPQVWLDHQVAEERRRLIFNWDAVEELFPEGVLDQMFETYCRLLDHLADEAAWHEADLRGWLLKEQLVKRAGMNATEAPVPGGLLHDLVAAQVARRGSETAVVTTGRTLTYRQLDGAANALAHTLRDRGARPNRLVAVVMEKGWEQVVAALAIVKAGAACLPVDPAVPRQRLRFLLEWGEVEIALTQPALEDTLAWPAGVERLVVTAVPGEEAAPLEPLQTARDLAYVLFTSGSTGRPKGVMIEHRSAVNRIVDSLERFEVGADDRFFALTALHHDMSVFDLFGALAAGARLVMPDAADIRNPAAWTALMARHRVTVWNSVPAFMEMLLEYLEHRGVAAESPCAALRMAFLGGDWIPLSVPERLRAFAPEVKLYSVGGPTEATLWDIYFPVAEVDAGWRSIPYGRPMTNTRYYVLNQAHEPCPNWVPGELCNVGTGLARGYWRDPARTAEAFQPHPQTGERMYCSGDLGRYMSDGNIEFLGREDFQVQIRGQRVELGEIEHALEQHGAVRSAVVAAVGEERSHRRLVGFVVPEARAAAAEAAPAKARSAATSPAGETAAAPQAPEATASGLERLKLKLSEPGLRADLEGRERIALPGPTLGEELLATYRGRASRREFLPAPHSAEQLGCLLSCLGAEPGADFPRYRYPSAGHLYAVQVALWVRADRVAGVPGGTYFYHPGDHVLEPLVTGAVLDRGMHVAVNREVFDGAAWMLFLVARLPALAPLYGERSRDYALLEAGYMGQLLMVAAPSDLGLCPVGALDVDRVGPLLGLEEGDQILHSFLGGIAGPPPPPGTIPTLPGAVDDAEGSEDAFLPQGWEATPAYLIGAREREEYARSAPGARRLDTARPSLHLGGALEGHLEEALSRRRSHREFLAESAVHLDRLGQLLGILRGLRTEEWLLPKYRYPSAGGLYPVQTYVHVKEGRVADLAGGTYYYHPRSHELVLLSRGVTLGDGIYPEENRSTAAASAFAVFLVGRMQAIRPRYGPWSRDFCLLEAGYIGQLLMTEAPADGLGLCPLGELDFAAVAPHLDLEDDDILLHTFLGGAISVVAEAAVGVVAGAAGQENVAIAAASAAAETAAVATLEQELEGHLRDLLPPHMVPSSFVLLDALPLTANGKVDRQRLMGELGSTDSRSEGGTARPRGALEGKIAAAIQEVLGLPRVGRNENFFELGGNSVHLIQFYGKLLPQIGREFPVVEVFNHPSVSSLAEYLGRQEEGAGALPESGERRAGSREKGRGRMARQLEKRKRRRQKR